MKPVQLILVPSVEIHLTFAEVKMICDCALSHYDSACRGSALRGGFVYGWMNRVPWADVGKTEIDARVNFNQADTTCKILENSAPRVDDGDRTALRNAFAAVVKVIQTRYHVEPYN